MSLFHYVNQLYYSFFPKRYSPVFTWDADIRVGQTSSLMQYHHLSIKARNTTDPIHAYICLWNIPSEVSRPQYGILRDNGTAYAKDFVLILQTIRKDGPHTQKVCLYINKEIPHVEIVGEPETTFTLEKDTLNTEEESKPSTKLIFTECSKTAFHRTVLED